MIEDVCTDDPPSELLPGQVWKSRDSSDAVQYMLVIMTNVIYAGNDIPCTVYQHLVFDEKNSEEREFDVKRGLRYVRANGDFLMRNHFVGSLKKGNS